MFWQGEWGLPPSDAAKTGSSYREIPSQGTRGLSRWFLLCSLTRPHLASAETPDPHLLWSETAPAQRLN